MAQVGDQLLQPEDGWKRYDDTHPAIKYEGNGWSFGTSSSYWNNGRTMTGVNGDSLKFKVKSKSFRIIVGSGTGSSKSIDIYINGKHHDNFSIYRQDPQFYTIAYQVLNLPKDEITEIKMVNRDSANFPFDAIDINEDGILLHPDEVTDPQDLEVGKRIRCHYTASNNKVGVFSNLGEEVYVDGINDFIPPESSATPNGCFYFICVDMVNDKPKLIADRNIQHSISWDSINLAGMTHGLQLKYNPQLPIVAGYKMNEKSGNVLHDVTGRYNGTIYGNPDMSGDVIKFDGVNDYVQFNNPVIKHGNKTIKFKFKANTIPSTNKVILGNLRGAGYSGIRIGVIGETGKLYIYASDNTGVIFESTGIGDNICDGEWKNITITLNGKVLRYYLNDMLTPMYEGELIRDEEDYRYELRIASRVYHDDYHLECQLADLQIYNDAIDPSQLTDSFESDKYTFTTRLLTGGINESDTDNEWDRYIVNSDLNGTITAGDDNVWNCVSGLSSLCSTTTTTGSNYRTGRGYHSIDFWGETYTNISTSNRCFRPLLEIEFLWQNKHMIYHNNEYKVYNPSTEQWEVVSTTLPNRQTFEEQGMDDLSVFDRKQKTFTIDMVNDGVLGEGNLFSGVIDLEKYFDVSRIEVKDNKNDD